MVNLTRIYTRTGDQGTTALGDMSRVAKTDLRISAYADANEANAVIGTAVALGGLARRSSRSSPACRTTCSTWARTCRRRWWRNPKFPPLRVEQFYVDKLEADCDRFNERLEKLRSFILPGGTRARPCCTRRARSSAAPSARPGRRWRCTARR